MADTGVTGATGPQNPTGATGADSSGTIADSLRTAIITAVVGQFMTWATAELGAMLPAWLLTSIVNPLLGIVVTPLLSWLVGKLIDLTILGVNEAWITVSTNADVSSVQSAAATLQNLPPDATPAQIAAAQQAFNTAAGNLITIQPVPIQE